jgi:hypothetical protein
MGGRKPLGGRPAPEGGRGRVRDEEDLEDLELPLTFDVGLLRSSAKDAN